MEFPIKQEKETVLENHSSPSIPDYDGALNALPRKKRCIVKKTATEVKTEDSTLDSSLSDTLESDSEYIPTPKKKKVVGKKKQPKTQKDAKKEVLSKVKKEPKSVKRKSATLQTGVKKRKLAQTKAVKTAGVDDIEDAPSCSKDSEGCVLDEAAASKAIEKIKQEVPRWEDQDVVAETTNISVHVTKNVITLLNQECTIPFIVRYRKEMTGGLSAEKVREIQAAYDEVKLVHKKVDRILKTVNNEKFFKKAAAELLSAKTLEEVELLYAPFKPGSKRTLAEKSKQLGLENVAIQLLTAQASLASINVPSFVKPVKGLESEENVLTGIQHIIADAVAKDRRILDFVRQKAQHRQIRLLSGKSAGAEKKDRQAHVEGKETDTFKYENYFKFNVCVPSLSPHQVMALNRGEKQKVLTVKLQIPPEVKHNISQFCWNTFLYQKRLERDTYEFLRRCMDDAYSRLIEPHMCRQIRSNLTKNAEKESISVFCSNVKSLLLTPPVRGKTVIGIDPGFSHGCKIAAVSSKGDVLNTDVIYVHSKGKLKSITAAGLADADKLKHLISTYSAEIIAIGNGTACRETEAWISDLNNVSYFSPLKVKYCIINESGASIWSVTKEAEEELPNMDPNIRSAVSIARRLQDPLLEYVKVEPKHLGVGMYQHDIPEVQLKKALDSVVEECVSFVGVDLNVCPEVLLRKISGLSVGRAKQIVAWRNEKGGFTNRQQLLEVKGLGQKSFEQCAGFVKILPQTSLAVCKPEPDSGKKKTKVPHNFVPLDRTIIHPESYSIAERFLLELKANPEEIGQQGLVNKVNSYMKFTCADDVAKRFGVGAPVMQLIVDAFRQLQDYDIRGELSQPLFLTSVQKFSDLQVGQRLTGRVSNVTGFGAFVDVGVGQDGLIHVSQMKGQKLGVGDRVTVRVLSVDPHRKRLGLSFCSKDS